MNDPSDDCDLIQLATDGDQQALADLFEQFRERLGQTVRLRMDHRLHGRIDVSDVLQDAFMDASRRLHEYVADPKVSLFVWLRSLTTQRLIDLHRHHFGAKMRSVYQEVYPRTRNDLTASPQSLAEFIVDSSCTPASKAVAAELQLRVRDALNLMDPIDREVVAMRHFEMMTNGEVADVLKLTKAAASNRYVRALQRLHGVLHGDFDES